jgi:hypothetical protein
MSSEPTRPQPARPLSTPPDPYARLWARADRRRRSAHRRSRRHTVRVTVVGVIAVVVAGLLAVPLVQRWVPTAGGSTGTGTTSGDSAQPVRKGRLAVRQGPLAGTPAEKYARGAEGIVLPRATQVGNWSAQEVHEVLRRTRLALAAARLDPRVVTQGDPTPYLQQLAPATRTMVRGQITSGGAAIGYVTRLGPGFTVDDAAGVRVAGSLRARAGRDGQLVVTADYVWVYPLKGGKVRSDAGAGARLVVLRALESYEWYRPQAIAAADRGLRPGGGESYTWNIDCGLLGKGLLALPPASQRTGPADTAAYNPKARPKSVPSTC